MQTIGFPREAFTNEKRCALLPVNVKAYRLLGAEVLIEKGLGASIHIDDAQYVDAGAIVASSRAALLSQADVLLSIHKIPEQELSALPGKLLISFLDPFNGASYVKLLRSHKITSISMEMIPRSSRCQKMDALSSQASLAGYVMVMKAINKLQTILPMMMTAAGTIKPAKVFVIGAGVAGLQAIATAKRLGAAVTAFDTRAVVAEQVQSLGAKFLKIDLGETKQTDQGYAQVLSTEQIAIQQAAQEKCIADSDIVITTAQLFGRKPPLLISKETIDVMKPGTVIVDMAADDGGNVEGTIAGETVVINGVTIIGEGNWPSAVAYNASQMYANNILSLVTEFWNEKDKDFAINLNDEILQNAVITHEGSVINELIRNLHAPEQAPFVPTEKPSDEPLLEKAS
jgi:NAD(P) transhydrogenase subunit alpha